MKYKLGEICSIVTGSTPKTNIPEFWDGNIKWITPAELSDNSYIIEDSIRKITELAVVKTGLSSFPKGTVILSSRAPIGKVAIAGCELYCNQGFKNLICSDKIYNKYLFWYLKSKTAFLNSLGRGATFKEISKQIVANIELEVPEYLEQEKIVKRLEKLSNLLSLRHQQLEKLDLLVKSQFIEMFGDPVNNDKNWQTNNLLDVCNCIVDCPHSTPKYTDIDTGFMCIRTSIVKKNQILWDEIEYIFEEEFNERIQRKRPEKGDIVYTREGAILGIAAIINRDCNVALGQRCMLLSPNKKVCSSEFLCMAMNFDTFLKKALKGLSGSASPHINVADIKEFKIIMPPLDLQNQFATFVQQVDKSKFVIKQSIEKLELLKSKLMQDYFG